MRSKGYKASYPKYLSMFSFLFVPVSPSPELVSYRVVGVDFDGPRAISDARVRLL